MVRRPTGSRRALAEPDERTLLILAAPVFRKRFGHVWPTDPAEA
jgi:hypothetical protein